ncbi:MAG TPA: MiaB/RimO family radical SAM methylthiotransferase [Anaerolineales bacterium]|nr:MiaB/RimO family radical SAM methylthiotransferase [Anaerolineales bacterium]
MNIYLDIVGCRLNQAEIEQFAHQFRSAGHVLVSMPEKSDLAVINTCTVTAAAASDSRGKIRQAKRAGVGELVVTGCWATLNPQEAANMEGVSCVVSNDQKDRLVPDLLNIPDQTLNRDPLEREPIPGARLRTRGFIKVQDGCDNRCSFCITTIARGPGRSRGIPEILADIRAACDPVGGPNSAKEVVLTGVHLGSWGYDLSPRLNLVHLVRSILDETGVPRLRLSSLEPWDLDEDFFALWENPRLCRHLHLPLQSGSATVLCRMARKSTPREYAKLVAAARAAAAGIAITTDVITGFPGESETEFMESLAFIREMDFAGGHVFTYSARDGTTADRMPEQVPHPLRKQRSARVRAVLAETSAAYRENFLEQVLPVLWESASTLGPYGWELSGLTGNYLRVKAQTPHNMWNTITPVRLTGMNGKELYGQINELNILSDKRVRK